MFARARRLSYNLVIVRVSDSQNAATLLDVITQKVGRKNVTVNLDEQGKIISISVPRTAFRIAVRESGTLRTALRQTQAQLQETQIKGWLNRRITVGASHDGASYVRQVKIVGISADDSETAKNLVARLDAIRDKLSDWGQIKIPALILLMCLGGTLYGAFKLKRAAQGIIEDLSNDTQTMLRDEKGLDQIVRKRSGQPALPTSQPSTESAAKNN